LILTLNAGSSSLKFAVFDGETAALRGKIDTNKGRIAGSGRDAPWPHGIEADAGVRDGGGELGFALFERGDFLWLDVIVHLCKVAETGDFCSHFGAHPRQGFGDDGLAFRGAENACLF